MASLSPAIRFFRYYLKAKTVFDLHSPMGYAFARGVLEDRRWYYVFSDAEKTRQEWMHNRKKILVEDFGAGSLSLHQRERSISELAKRVATPPLYCRWLFHIVRAARPSTMLEMGTSLGISALYQAAAAPLAHFITIEGCPQTAKIAESTFQKTGFRGTLQVGRFDQQLPLALASLGRLDHLFLDGDHSQEGTLRYLELCLPFTHENTCWVIGDIHWSAGMERAWEHIKGLPGVCMTIDLFGLGVVFFKPVTPAPVHLVLAPSHWKPWHLGRWAGL